MVLTSSLSAQEVRPYAVVEDGIVLTEQFRDPVGARVIDFPAGLVGDDRSLHDPVARPLGELDDQGPRGIGLDRPRVGDRDDGQVQRGRRLGAT